MIAQLNPIRVKGVAARIAEGSCLHGLNLLDVFGALR
jgi:hypothetical protein